MIRPFHIPKVHRNGRGFAGLSSFHCCRSPRARCPTLVSCRADFDVSRAIWRSWGGQNSCKILWICCYVARFLVDMRHDMTPSAKIMTIWKYGSLSPIRNMRSWPTNNAVGMVGNECGFGITQVSVRLPGASSLSKLKAKHRQLVDTSTHWQRFDTHDVCLMKVRACCQPRPLQTTTISTDIGSCRFICTRPSPDISAH